MLPPASSPPPLPPDLARGGRRRHCRVGGCGLESDRERAVMDEEERDGGNKDKVSEEVRRRESGGWVPEERARSSRLDILYVLVFL